MGIYYDLFCLETGERLNLYKLCSTKMGEVSFPSADAPTKQDINDMIVKFLILNIGKAVVLIPDNLMDCMDHLVDLYDEAHDGELAFNQDVGYEEISKRIADDSNINYYNYLSPMVIDCMLKTLDRYDWSSIMEMILSRVEPNEQEHVRSLFFWLIEKDKKEEKK